MNLLNLTGYLFYNIKVNISLNVRVQLKTIQLIENIYYFDYIYHLLKILNVWKILVLNQSKNMFGLKLSICITKMK